MGHPKGVDANDYSPSEDWGNDYDEPDPMEEAEADCGLRHDGQCGLAGTEHCDFICPFRDSEDFAGSAAWHAKRKRK